MIDTKEYTIDELLFADGRIIGDDDRFHEEIPDRYNGDISEYLRLEKDGRVNAALKIRISGVISHRCKIVPGGTSKADKELADFIKLQFLGADGIPQSGILDNFAEQVLKIGLLCGYAPTETIFRFEDKKPIIDDVRVREPYNFEFIKVENPNPKLLNYKGFEVRFRSMRNPEGKPLPVDSGVFIYTFNELFTNPCGTALGAALWQPVRLKRLIRKYWIEFAHTFGEPLLIGEINPDIGFTPEQVRELQRQLNEFLRSVRRKTTGVLPPGTSIKIVEASRSSTVDIFERLHTIFDNEISDIILGSLYNNASQGFSGQPAENDAQSKLEIVKTDADIFHSQLNRFIYWYSKIIDPKAKPPQIWRDFDEQIGRSVVSEAAKLLFDQGWKLKNSAIIENFGDNFEKIEEKPPDVWLSGDTNIQEDSSTLSQPNEPSPVEQSPVEQSPVEPSPVEPSPVEPSLGESLVEPSPVEPYPVEPYPVEPSLGESPVEPSVGEYNKFLLKNLEQFFKNNSSGNVSNLSFQQELEHEIVDIESTVMKIIYNELSDLIKAELSDLIKPELETLLL